MNKREAAEYLGVSDRAIERYASQGKLSVRYEKGKRGDAAVYDEGELRRLKAELDGKRGIVRAAVQPPDTSDEEPRQLMKVSDVSDMARVLSTIAIAARENRAKELPPTELAVKHLLTLTEASRLSGLSRNHLLEGINTKKLKAKKIGRGWKIKPQDLKTYTDKL